MLGVNFRSFYIESQILHAMCFSTRSCPDILWNNEKQNCRLARKTKPRAIKKGLQKIWAFL
jgi:hypothetical protein